MLSFIESIVSTVSGNNRMPDLSNEGVARFWKAYEDPMIYRVVTFMEGVESWTLDDSPILEESISRLSKELDHLVDIDMQRLGKEANLIRLAANIRTGRALRLLQAIDTAHPGAASKLLIHAEETSQSNDDPEGVFLRRNIVFERLRLLSRVFSRQRFNLVMKALEGDEHD